MLYVHAGFSLAAIQVYCCCFSRIVTLSPGFRFNPLYVASRSSYAKFTSATHSPAGSLSGLNQHSLQLLLEKSDWPLIASGQRLFSNEQYGRCYIYLLSGEAELIYSSGSAVHTAEQPFPIGYGVAGLPSAVALTDCVCLFLGQGLG